MSLLSVIRLFLIDLNNIPTAACPRASVTARRHLSGPVRRFCPFNPIANRQQLRQHPAPLRQVTSSPLWPVASLSCLVNLVSQQKASGQAATPYLSASHGRNQDKTADIFGD